MAYITPDPIDTPVGLRAGALQETLISLSGGEPYDEQVAWMLATSQVNTFAFGPGLDTFAEVRNYDFLTNGYITSSWGHQFYDDIPPGGPNSHEEAYNYQWASAIAASSFATVGMVGPVGGSVPGKRWRVHPDDVTTFVGGRYTPKATRVGGAIAHVRLFYSAKSSSGSAASFEVRLVRASDSYVTSAVPNGSSGWSTLTRASTPAGNPNTDDIAMILGFIDNVEDHAVLKSWTLPARSGLTAPTPTQQLFFFAYTSAMTLPTPGEYAVESSVPMSGDPYEIWLLLQDYQREFIDTGDDLMSRVTLGIDMVGKAVMPRYELVDSDDWSPSTIHAYPPPSLAAPTTVPAAAPAFPPPGAQTLTGEATGGRATFARRTSQ